MTNPDHDVIAPMEAGDGYGGRGTQQPSDEVSLQPEWRRRTASTGREQQNLTLQPEWRRGRSTETALPSSSRAGDEAQKKDEEQKKEVILQPEWRRSRSTTTTAATAYPWNQNQNYSVRKQLGIRSSSSGVQRSRNIDESWRNAPPPGIFSIPFRNHVIAL